MVVRFIDPVTGKAVIEVMEPTQAAFSVMFRYTILVGKTHRILDLEMALASKFAAMVSPNREQSKKLIDAGDFADVVANNRERIGLRKLKRLGDKVYRQSGEESCGLSKTSTRAERFNGDVFSFMECQW